MMFGYATNETDRYIPVTLDLAHLIMKTLAEIRKEGKVMTYLRPDAKSQVTVKYSDDGVPQCIDTIVGGSVQFSMTIDAVDHQDTNLFVKFIQDIKDTLTGDKPIGAAGNDAPSYYNSGEVTWENRRNQ